MSSVPNVVIYASHDTGRHIGPYGVETVQTPSADEFAKGGVVFQNSYCVAPTCSASRAALFTGRYPHAAGVNGLARASTGFTLNQESLHLASRLRSKGYATALFGQAHEAVGAGSPPAHLEKLGFDHTQHGYRGARVLAGELAEWLSGHDTTTPFYAQVCPGETHREFRLDGAEPDKSCGITVPPYLVDSEPLRDDLSWFQGSIKKWDDGLGHVLSVLNDHNLAEQTIVIVTTDHGIPYPRAKASLYDAGIEIMLMISYPQLRKEGERVEHIVSNVDVVPTVLDAVGIEPDPRIQGRSFWPLLTGGEYQPRQAVFSERTFHASYDPMRCARTSRYKYIRNFEAVTPDWFFSEGFERHTSIRGVRDSDAIIKAMRSKSRPAEELYDLQADPTEMHNLAGDPEFETTRKELSGSLHGWMVETEDPLLRGSIGSPAFYDNVAALKADSPQT